MEIYHTLFNILTKENIDYTQYDIFLETGLYDANTLISLNTKGVSEYFTKIYSVEIVESFIKDCISNNSFLKEPKYNLINGDSAVEIKKIVEDNADKKFLIWLDGHYSAGFTGKSSLYGECPVLQELELLKKLKISPTIIIDDASFFQNSPPPPHDPKDWPSTNTICEKLKEINPSYNITTGSYILAK
jgi:hypothetical protein